MKNELISIIIPVYNVNENDFKKCISSVISQSYKNMEILLIDDGSTKEIALFCDSFKNLDHRISVFHTKNYGVSHARNYGFIKSKGTFICFLDSDDLIESNMIEVLYNNAKKYNKQISSCGYSYIELDGKKYNKYDTNKIYNYSIEEALISFFEDESFGVSVWNKLFSRELINGIKFNEKLKINEDRLFVFEAINNSNGVIYEDICLYNYIKRDNSATTSKFNISRFDVIEVNNLIKKNLKISNNNIIFNMKKNEIIYLIRLVRELALSKEKMKYKNEYNMILLQLKNLYSKEIINLMNPFEKIETILIVKFNLLYSLSINIIVKFKFLKRIKNILQKRR